VTNSTVLFFLVLFAFAGHRYSVRSAMARGTTPWHIPSAIWALLCLTFGPFGLLLEFVAVRTTKPVSLPIPLGGVPSHMWSASITPESTADAASQDATPAHPAANDGSGKVALFGWYPDPTGRFERRYWDGKGWTSLVENNRVTQEDPL
jgi:hypothetical protein